MNRHSRSGVVSPAEEKFAAALSIKASDFETGTFTGIASVFGSQVDAFIPTIIEKGAFTKTLKERKRPIKILYMHDMYHPIGVPIQLRETAEGLEVEARISKTTLGQEVLTLMRDGVLDSLSIGFDPVKWTYDEDQEIRYIKELRLWEISVVTFGADAEARISSVHSVVPFQDLPLGDAGMAWDRSAAEKRVREWAGGGEDKSQTNWGKYRRAHVWFDGSNPEEVGSYKLLIADIVDGKLTAIPRAIFAAAVVVQGGRGGVAIPNEERDKVKTHLGRYYRKLDRIAPWDNDSFTPILEAHQQGFEIQTLIFPKKFWDSAEACKDWASEHDFKSGDVDETGESYRLRQRDPDDFARLRTICLSPSRDAAPDDCRIKAVGGPVSQSIANLIETLTGGEPDEALGGRVLSAKSAEMIKRAIAALNELLQAAEPPPAAADPSIAGEQDAALTARLEQLRDAELALAANSIHSQ